MDSTDTNKPEETCSNQKVEDSLMEATKQKVNDDSTIKTNVEVQNNTETCQIVIDDLTKDNGQYMGDDIKAQSNMETCRTVSSDLTKNEDICFDQCNDGKVQSNIETCEIVSDDLAKDEGNRFDQCKNVNEQNNKETCQTMDLAKDETTVNKHFDQCSNSEANKEENMKADGNNSDPVIKVQMPLCADYRSDSDSDSVDSESDSPASTTESSTSSESEDNDSDDSGTVKSGNIHRSRKPKPDMTLTDLPPIEDLKISVPEDACEEIGTVTSIVDTLVVVESYKGTAALDIDTVLFLENGKRTLGRIFEILGPISEPVYAVRFNNQDQINSLKIEKGLKVYYAPKTQHTSFVFLSEVLKNRGSDASWKDNVEPPQEFQDFSDDEEERKCRKGNNSEGSHDHTSRKRPFQRTGQVVQPGRFQRPETHQQGIFNTPRFSPPSRFRSPHSVVRYAPPNIPAPPFTYNIPPYPGENFMNPYPTPPQSYFPPRFSGPPFPTFGVLPYGNFQQQPFYQQRTHAFPTWRGPIVRPPPPPPPPSQPLPPSTKD